MDEWKMFRTIFIQAMIYLALIIKLFQFPSPPRLLVLEIFQSYVQVERKENLVIYIYAAVLYLTRIMCMKRLISKTGEISFLLVKMSEEKELRGALIRKLKYFNNKIRQT